MCYHWSLSSVDVLLLKSLLCCFLTGHPVTCQISLSVWSRKENKYFPCLSSLAMSWGTPLMWKLGHLQLCFNLYLLFVWHWQNCEKYKSWPSKVFSECASVLGVPSKPLLIQETSSLAFRFPGFRVYLLLALFAVLCPRWAEGVIFKSYNGCHHHLESHSSPRLAGWCEKRSASAPVASGNLRTSQNAQLQYLKNKIHMSPLAPVSFTMNVGHHPHGHSVVPGNARQVCKKATVLY